MPHVGNFPYGIFPKPLSIHPAAFVPQDQTFEWLITNTGLTNNTVLTTQYFRAPVYLPHGARVTKLTLLGYRDDELATMRLQLYQLTNAQTTTIMATVNADWTTGISSGYDDTIVQAVIDNELYSYVLEIQLDPNDDALDVQFIIARIDWK